MQPENSVRAAAHEKLLVKALLQRKLSHAFSREELDRLKQKGVYKEAEHEKLDAERLLVTRQVCFGFRCFAFFGFGFSIFRNTFG